MKKYIFILLLILPTASYGAMPVNPAYVSQTGSGSACTLGSPCALSYANTNADDDDIVYLLDTGGNFSGTGIVPANSGSSGHPITFMAYTGDTPVITGVTPSINLTGISYVTIDGITFTGSQASQRYVTTSSASPSTGITIQNCNFAGSTNSSWTLLFFSATTALKLYNNTISGAAQTADTQVDSIGLYGCQDVLIDGNTMGAVTHHPFMVKGGLDIVIQNNIVNNTWRHGGQSWRNGSDFVEYLLVQNNVFQNLGQTSAVNPYTADQGRVAHTWELGSNRTIFRFNKTNNCNSGYSTYAQAGETLTQNQIYHNTYDTPQLFGNSANYDGLGSWSDNYSYYTYNRFMNNIIWASEGSYDLRWRYDAGGITQASGNLFGTNLWGRSTGFSANWIGNTYSAWSTLEAAWSQFSGNAATNPQIDANSDLTVSSTAAIDQAAYLATIASKSVNQLTLGTNEAYAFWPAGRVTGIAGDTIYSDQGYSTTVVSVDAHNQITVADATNFSATDQITVVNYDGAGPDIGYKEYDTGVPTGTEEAIYTLDASGVDSEDVGTDYDLSAVGSPDHTSGVGITVDAYDDGYYSGTFFDSNQITICAIANYSTFGAYVQPLAGRYNLNSQRCYSIGANPSQNFIVDIGYNGGASREEYNHGSTLSAGTDYGMCATIDGVNKLLNMYLFNTSGETIGTDVENTAILSARSFNYNEGNLLVGLWENGASPSTLYFANATIKHVQVLEGIATKSDCAYIIAQAGGGGGEPSPSISSNCWSSDGTNCLSANWDVGTPGTDIYHLVVGSEAFYSEGGPATFAAQVTVGGSGSKTLTYSSGYGTTTLVFKYTTHIGDYVADFQLASTSPISEGTDNIVDSESNAFTLTGLDNALTYAPTIILRGRTGTSASGCVMR